MVCQRAVTLIVDLCLHNSTLLEPDTCRDYLLLLSSQSSDHQQPGRRQTYSSRALSCFACSALLYHIASVCVCV